MSKSKASNSAQVQLQAQEAAEARAKEEARKARLEKGKRVIEELYTGKPIYENVEQSLDLSKFNPNAKAPMLAPGTVSTVAQTPDWGLPAGLSYRTTKGDKGITMHEIVDAKGRVIGSSDTLEGLQGGDYTYTTREKTGKTSGGFGKPFYDKYKKGYLDYYLPELSSQFGDTRDALTYDLARAGTLRSSLAADKQADIKKQYDVNEASIRSKADVATGELKSRVANEKKSLLDQLYATEDPDVTANTALNRIAATKAAQPDLSPLGRLFDFGTIGQNAYNAAYDRAFGATAYSGAGVTGGTASPGTSTGKTYS